MAEDSITLRVKDQAGEETFFKVRFSDACVRERRTQARTLRQDRGSRTVTPLTRPSSYTTTPYPQVKKETKFEKIIAAYAQRKGIGANSLRFMIDGERVKPDTTPKMLELEDNDQVDVMLETVGGL